MNNQSVQKFFLYSLALIVTMNSYLTIKLSLSEVPIVLHFNSSICVSLFTDTLLVINNLINEPMFNLIVQAFFIIIMSSWSRAAGPRARVDFLSDLT